ncbi:MAG: signal peptide peptidase SppA [Bacteroidales bacterium]|nr:signal peptide peptidase SppA [Bacteroidales bacterium]
MKQFFKFMLASFAGTLLTVILILIVFAIMITSIANMAQKESVKIEPHTILRIAWNAPIMDRGSQNPFDNFNYMTFKAKKTIGLNDILENIDKAAKDPDIDGIFLDMETVPAGFATTEEIRQKLLDFKKTGKFIISYANNYDQKELYLASAGDKIYLNPEGLVLLKGLTAQVMFLKNLMDKLDIKAQIIRGPNNKYKSAVEPLMLDKMSDANREQMKALLGSFWDRILSAVSKSRHISVQELNQLADNLSLSNAEQAEKYHLVDGVIYRDQVLDSLKKLTHVGKDGDLSMINFGKYTYVKPTEIKKDFTRNAIAVIYAQGDISQGTGTDNSIGSATLASTIRKARTDKYVKAIVMRVNSPGGDAQAADIIRREVALAAKDKPFIVSMGDYAASGGYWISTNSNYIFAEPNTITGSIGVFGIIPNFQQFFNKKLGITFDKVMTNKNSDFVDVMSPLSPLQEKRLNEGITRIYEQFTSLVARTRHLRQSYVDSIARGHVWAGTEALKLGLVDKLGGLQDAIAYAAKEAKLGKDYRIINFPKRKDIFQQFIEELSGEAQTKIISSKLGNWDTYFNQIKTFETMKGVQARLPFLMQIQ